jgi:hypothetical protein
MCGVLILGKIRKRVKKRSWLFKTPSEKHAKDIFGLKYSITRLQEESLPTYNQTSLTIDT